MDPRTRDKVVLFWLLYQQVRLFPAPVLREIALYLDFCPVVLGTNCTSLYLYTLPVPLPRSLSLPVAFSEGTRHCWITSHQVLFVGGGSCRASKPAVSDAYIVDIRYKCGISRQHSMFVPRYSAGVIAFEGMGYVFGGYCVEKAMVSCEKFDILSGDWEVIPQMRYPRHSFSPVSYKAKIYLPDISKSHGRLEIFTPSKQKFDQAAIRLPTNSSNSCAFLVEDCLYVISCSRFLWYWRVDTEETGRKEVQLEKSALSSGPARVVSGKVYWTEFHTGELADMDLREIQGKWAENI